MPQSRCIQWQPSEALGNSWLEAPLPQCVSAQRRELTAGEALSCPQMILFCNILPAIAKTDPVTHPSASRPLYPTAREGGCGFNTQMKNNSISHIRQKAEAQSQDVNGRCQESLEHSLRVLGLHLTFSDLHIQGRSHFEEQRRNRPSCWAEGQLTAEHSQSTAEVKMTQKRGTA